MEGDSSFTFGPTTPFKAGPDDQAKKSSDDPRKALPETQKKTVSGLFGSPTFDSGATGSSTSKPNTLLDGNKRDKDETATLAQIQFATPSPFPLRTKRSRSEVSAASDAQLASSHQDRAPHDLSSTEGRVPEGFSPVASFPSLEPEGIPGPCTTAAPKAQRDLFADVSNSSAVKPATLSVPDVTRKPRRVVNLGDLVVEGLKQQQQQQAEPAAAVSSDEEEDDPQEADLVMGAAARVVLSKKDEEWLTKMVIHYNTSKLAQKL